MGSRGVRGEEGFGAEFVALEPSLGDFAWGQVLWELRLLVVWWWRLRRSGQGGLRRGHPRG